MPKTIDIEQQVRNALEQEVLRFSKLLEHEHKWSPRERIRFMKALDQLAETNGVLERARGIKNGRT